MSQPEIVLNCQACGGKLRAPRSAIGTTVGCPGCKTGVYVPDPTPTPNKGFTPSVMIVDPRRKLGVESRKDTAATSVEDAFKERLRRTTEDTYRVDPNNPVMKRRDMRKLKHSKNLTNWDTAPQRRQRSARSRRILFALYCATAIILLLMVGVFWKSVKRTGPRPVAAVIAPKTLETLATSDFSEQLWETIQNFCTAPTASDLLPFIRDPRRVGPKLIKYYNAENPWTPLVLGEKPDLEVRGDFILLSLRLKDFTTIPLGLEKTKEGFLVDWESFVGYCELPWPELRQKRPRTPVLARAVISPTEYFNMDFPSATTHRSYRISDLHSDHVFYGYVPINGPVDLQIKKTLLYAPSVLAVLRVRYPVNSTNDRQLEITEVLESGWIFRKDDVPEATDQVNTPGKVPTALPEVP